MAKKKVHAHDTPPDIPVTLLDIAGFIHLHTRPQSRSETQQLLDAAGRVSRLWARRLPPCLDEIEEELKNGPFDAYFIIGMIEISRRYDCQFREDLRERMERNSEKLNALIENLKGPK